jgi:hypothetical protein
MKNILVAIFFGFSVTIMAQQSITPPSKEFQQFDFWIGNWDVYKFGTETLAGKSQIQSIIDGYGILENYSVGEGKYQGKSLNKYNPAKQRWEQYWTDNTGLTLFLTGGFVNGKMILSDEISGDPKLGINQIIWELMKNGNVRQTWNLSKDGGKTWTVLFDGEYKKSKE